MSKFNVGDAVYAVDGTFEEGTFKIISSTFVAIRNGAIFLKAHPANRGAFGGWSFKAVFATLAEADAHAKTVLDTYLESLKVKRDLAIEAYQAATTRKGL